MTLRQSNGALSKDAHRIRANQHIKSCTPGSSNVVLKGGLRCALKIGNGEGVIWPGGRWYPCPPRIRVQMRRIFQ